MQECHILLVVLLKLIKSELYEYKKKVIENGASDKNWSKVSQEVFWELYEELNDKYNEIYFATHREDGDRNEDKNHEYLLETGTSFRLLDFYIPELKKVIEFDGTYWHGEVGRGNKEADKLRDEEILKTEKVDEILHIKERDWNESPEKVIDECLEFLQQNRR